MHSGPVSSSVLSDRLFGLLMVILAITYFYLARQLPEPFGAEDEAIGPQGFPRILALLLGLPGLWLMIKPQPGVVWPGPRLAMELALNVVVLVLFALLLEPLGFLLTALLCCGFISWRMGARWPLAFGIAAAYSLGLYVLFDRGLDLALPAGVLGRFF